MSVLSYPIDCMLISVCFVVVEGQEVDKDVIEDEDDSSEGEESIEGYSEEGKKDDDISGGSQGTTKEDVPLAIFAKVSS